MRNKFLTLFLMAVLLFFIAACGGATTPEAAPSAEEATPA